jgi:MFS family permease
MAIYMEQTLKVDPSTTNLMVAAALGVSTPFFVVFGKLSDSIGRKKLVVGGCLLGAIVMFPLFKALTYYANPGISDAQRTSPVVVVADPNECSFQFDPSGQVPFSTSCDVAKSAVTRAGVPYVNEAAPAGTIATVRVGDNTLTAFDGTGLSRTELRARSGEFAAQFKQAVVDAGYPAKADQDKINFPMLFLVMFAIAILGPVVYGSLAAWLVELFPARIRYTSMSLPYHIGNGWFGGFLPTVSFALMAYTGNIYSGLWYPVIVGLITFVVGGLFLRETNGVAAEH